MKKSKKNIIVYGSQEFGRTIKELALSCDYEFLGFIDDYNQGEQILGNFEEIRTKYSKSEYEIALAIGYKNLTDRWKVYLKVKEADFTLSTLIHPAAYVAKNSNVGEGSFIMAGSVIDIRSKIEEIVVAWPGVVVNHDCVIGANSFLSPNSTICGSVKTGKHCFIGAGSVVVDHINIPDNTFIKAGQLYK